MSRILLISISIIFFCGKLNAQESSFGIKGGLNLTMFKITEGGFGDRPVSQKGFYAGFFSEIPANEGFSIQPEILFIGINHFRFLNFPIYAKYEVAPNMHLLAGPSLNYFFDFFVNKLKVGADISTAYNITTALDVHIKFALGLDVLTPNGLFFGLGYKL